MSKAEENRRYYLKRKEGRARDAEWTNDKLERSMAEEDRARFLGKEERRASHSANPPFGYVYPNWD
jgi:hypothetical protein